MKSKSHSPTRTPDPEPPELAPDEAPDEALQEAPDGPVDAEQLTPGAVQILDAATSLFYDHGIHAVGVDTIAEESGVTKRTLYNCFGSKDALVSTYLQTRHTAWWSRLEERLAAATGPRTLVLFDVYAEDAHVARRGCAFLNAAAELPHEHPGHMIVREHKEAVEAMLRRLVAEDRRHAGSPPDADEVHHLARHLFLLLEGAFAHHGIHGVGLLTEAQEIAHELIRR